MQYFIRAMNEGYQESSVGKAQRFSCAKSNPVIFRYDRSAAHHSVLVFKHDNSAGLNINTSIGPFRHDGSASRSKRTKEFSSQENQAQYITAIQHERNIPKLISKLLNLAQFVPQISVRRLPKKISQEYTEPAAYSNLLLYQLTRNSTEDDYKLKFKAAREQKNDWSTIAKISNSAITSRSINTSSQVSKLRATTKRRRIGVPLKTIRSRVHIDPLANIQIWLSSNDVAPGSSSHQI
ncbi:hypothetical protein F511_41643 [Dorcoceras hygrometricum]|uniref:Uncharacterized protein n=1 Tax=Dorcoceras hygrometricum TaxID=472368 RepID=A0A2Z7AFE5_9LAMI|nr:hypothetical protein F511_41643 [Dorcoceras hygrometricum]